MIRQATIEKEARALNAILPPAEWLEVVENYFGALRREREKVIEWEKAFWQKAIAVMKTKRNEPLLDFNLIRGSYAAMGLPRWPGTPNCIECGRPKGRGGFRDIWCSNRRINSSKRKVLTLAVMLLFCLSAFAQTNWRAGDWYLHGSTNSGGSSFGIVGYTTLGTNVEGVTGTAISTNHMAGAPQPWRFSGTVILRPDEPYIIAEVPTNGGWWVEAYVREPLAPFWFPANSVSVVGARWMGCGTNGYYSFCREAVLQKTLDFVHWQPCATNYEFGNWFHFFVPGDCARLNFRVAPVSVVTNYFEGVTSENQTKTARSESVALSK